MASNLSLWGILDANKLTNLNYMDWLRNLRIILTQKKLSYILDSSDIELIGEDASKEEKATHNMWLNDIMTVRCIMLASMSNEI